MKKNIFLTLALVLAFVGTAWASGYIKFTASFQNATKIYTGTELTNPTIIANCTYTTSGTTAATDAGTYTITVSPSCPEHMDLADIPGSFIHTGNVNLDWTIERRDIAKAYGDGHDVTIEAQDGSTVDATTGIFTAKWTGNTINYSDIFKLTFNSSELSTEEYEVHIYQGNTPAQFLNAGRYTIVFTGKKNFFGTISKMVDVKKDLSTTTTDNVLTYDIPTQIMLYQGNVTDVADIANATYTLEKLNLKITDANSHELLYEGEDYTLEYYSEYNSETDNTPIVTGHPEQLALTQTGNPTSSETGNMEKMYIVRITGTGTKYTGSKNLYFYTLAEYQKTVANASDADPHKILWYRISTTNPGYPTNTTPGANSLSTAKGQLTVGAPIGAAIDKETNKLTIPADHKATVGNMTDPGILFDVVGIEKYSFAGCSVLRWIDSKIPAATWTPISLDRTVPDSPFFGVPKPALVYLFGTTVTGENYVYKFGTDDLRCAQYRIYEDITGQQTLYSE